VAEDRLGSYVSFRQVRVERSSEPPPCLVELVAGDRIDPHDAAIGLQRAHRLQARGRTLGCGLAGEDDLGGVKAETLGQSLTELLDVERALQSVAASIGPDQRCCAGLSPAMRHGQLVLTLERSPCAAAVPAGDRRLCPGKLQRKGLVGCGFHSW